MLKTSALFSALSLLLPRYLRSPRPRPWNGLERALHGLRAHGYPFIDLHALEPLCQRPACPHVVVRYDTSRPNRQSVSALRMRDTRVPPRIFLSFPSPSPAYCFVSLLCFVSLFCFVFCFLSSPSPTFIRSRFSGDVNQMDEKLPDALGFFAFMFSSVVFVLVLMTG